jgi:hypothetical protein
MARTFTEEDPQLDEFTAQFPKLSAGHVGLFATLFRDEMALLTDLSSRLKASDPSKGGRPKAAK